MRTKYLARWIGGFPYDTIRTKGIEGYFWGPDKDGYGWFDISYGGPASYHINAKLGRDVEIIRLILAGDEYEANR